MPLAAAGVIFVISAVVSRRVTAVVAAGVAMLAGALAEPVWSPAPAVGGLRAVLSGFGTLVPAIRGQRDVP